MEKNGAVLLLLLILGLTNTIHVSSGFDFPSASSDIAAYTTITATSTCSSDKNSDSCNTTCPTREAFPTIQNKTLPNIPPDNCKGVEGNTYHLINTGNGNVLFDVSTVNCTEIKRKVSAGSNGYFSLSFWIKISSISGNKTLLTIGESIQLRYYGPGILELTVLSTMVKQNTTNIVTESAWKLVVLRYNGMLDWFVHTQTHKISIKEQLSLATVNLTFGPSEDLTNTETIEMADARWYSEALTDREIGELYTGTFEDVLVQSDCRCPQGSPTLVKNSSSLPSLYQQQCTSVDGGSGTVPRLNPDSRDALFMIDNDNDTFWMSDETNEVTIRLSMTKTFQVRSVVLTSLTLAPLDTLEITFNNTEIRKWLFKRSCTGQENCRLIDDYHSGTTFSFQMENSNISNRPDYEALRTNSVSIYLKANGEEKAVFKISELQVKARCDCYGNDADCTISEGDYTCTCKNSTHTNGTNCDTCAYEYYRELEDEFTCLQSCNCDMAGRTDSVCIKIGGQCPCKTNTEGRQCNTCKFNTGDFGSDALNGCTNCACNPDGITSCDNSLTCDCKSNVDNTTGNCMDCMTHFYNISNEKGCEACNCNDNGTMSNTECDQTTGLCDCKQNVQGRTCDTCVDERYGLTASTQLCSGCTCNCSCNFIGSDSMNCDKITGNCACSSDRTNRLCGTEFNSVHPNYGPVAGGTRVTISGKNMLSQMVKTDGLTVRIGTLDQQIVSRNASMIVINTTAVQDTSTESIQCQWSKVLNQTGTFTEKQTLQFKFEFKPNPNIVSPDWNIRSYQSGGCSLIVYGTHLDSVPFPTFLIHNGPGQPVETPCCGPDSKCMATELHCKTPSMYGDDNTSDYDYGFGLDNVNMYERIENVKFSVLPDPVITGENTDTFRNTFDKVFRIKGENLNMACHDADVTIQLGSETCRLLHRENTSLSCDLDEGFPGESREVEVTVKIGNYEKVWGKLIIKSFWGTTEFIYIASGVGAFVLIILIIVIVCCIRRRRRRGDKPDMPRPDYSSQKRRPNSYSDMPGPLISTTSPATADTIPLQSITHIPQRLEAPPEKKNPADEFCSRLDRQTSKIVSSSLVSRPDVQPGHTCTHKGTYVRVIVGQFASSSSTSNSEQNLTLKTLVSGYPKEGDLPAWLNEGLLESTKLRDFTNDNVLRMMGIAVDDKNVYILYPEMENRTLKQYLLKDQENPVPDDIRMNVCVQIAEGMNYLNMQGVVHRDLACRNCWVSSDMVIKIADSSFSSDLYPEEYMERNGRKQPVRWMAPESLVQDFYDIRSDVWSFGVLMWEIFTNGYLPYFDITDDQEVIENVTRYDFKLGRPEDCNNQVFSIMEECFRKKGDQRPNFYVITNNLGNIISPNSSQADQEDYINARQGPGYYNQKGLLQDSGAGGTGNVAYINTELAKEIPPGRPPR